MQNGSQNLGPVDMYHQDIILVECLSDVIDWIDFYAQPNALTGSPTQTTDDAVDKMMFCAGQWAAV